MVYVIAIALILTRFTRTPGEEPKHTSARPPPVRR